MNLIRDYLVYEEKYNTEFDNFQLHNFDEFNIISYYKEVGEKYNFRHSVTFFDGENTISVLIAYKLEDGFDKLKVLEKLNFYNIRHPEPKFYINEFNEIVIYQLLFEKEDINEVMAHIYNLQEKLFTLVYELQKL